MAVVCYTSHTRVCVCMYVCMFERRMLECQRNDDDVRERMMSER
jgi:hypothetical protein